MLGTLETTFHGQTTFRLVGGSLNWSETPYCHYELYQKLPLSPGAPHVRKMTFLKNWQSFNFKVCIFEIRANFLTFLHQHFFRALPIPVAGGAMSALNAFNASEASNSSDANNTRNTSVRV